MPPKSLSKFINFIFITAFLASTLTGCWNRRELDTLGFVTALGVDRTGEDKIEITVHIAKPFAIARATEGSVSPEKSFWVVSSTGSTAFEAIRNLLLQSPRRPFYAHNRFIVIGEECARTGVKEILDLFARDGEARRLARVEVVKGATAKDFMQQVEFELERLPSEGGQGISRSVQEGLSAEPVDCTLNSFLQWLETEGVEPIAVRIDMVPKNPAAPSNVGHLLREQVKISSKHGGAAVFKGDKLVGWLDEKEMRGVNWVTGKVRSGILVIEQPNEKGKLVSLEILRAKSKLQPEVKNGEVLVTLRIDAEANLGEMQGTLDLIKYPQAWTEMERKMVEAIETEVMAAISKAKELNSDIFGFGAALNRRHPEEWDSLKDRWDLEFPRIDVKLEINAKLRRMGLVTRSSEPR